ncbi:FAD-dependent oxidoreductase [Natrarchaeobaculum aegyptiacum]|uniref:(2Fe-2S)-binding protein n=1 Tax=Natrarchaeobaculum aegyptiacum TaxID=745377 RepID=A0A2Z2HS45_9EURY|nr:FAD-dependent oxidoreductase [Natrarchaeobaculum aegyptiacum]ARS90016.1 (2Fe-2S)-binding protein [Natrarchaeobaculum aegyptiacum]
MPDFSCDPGLPGVPTSPWLASTLEGDDADDFHETDLRDGADDGDSDRVADAGEPQLEGIESADVAVIGAGIAGLSTAIELRERGQSVVVLERDRVATGVTGKSTAKLTSQHGQIYDHLRSEFGPQAARRYGQLQERAIDTVEQRIEDLGIDAGFERVPSYLYGNDPGPLEREAKAAQAAGLEATYVTSVPPFERAEAAVRFDEQAWFHPRRYLCAIADELRADEEATIYERTRVTDLDPGQPNRVYTRDGVVHARQVVLATGFPLLDRAGYFARMHPKRSYVLGLELEGPHPEGMYYRSGENYRSVRSYRGDDGDLLLVGGENHKTGQGGSTAQRYRRLLRWARERFSVDSVAYHWSTQDYVSADRVPLVGRAGPGTSTVYVATGFRGWGMTNGVAAGRLLARLCTGERPPAADLFRPLRFTPKPALGSTITENADVASQFLTDWARALVSSSPPPLDPGEGQVVREGGTPVAYARDEDGQTHAVSAVCSHMACLVEWNDAECSWDCPCHGSRFSPDGAVLEGPATDDLSDRDPPER